MIKRNKFFLNSEIEFISLDETDEYEELYSIDNIDIMVSLDHLHLLKYCRNIRYMIISGGYVSSKTDFSELYRHTELKGLYLDYYEDEGYSEYTVRLQPFEDLEILIARTSFDFDGIESCEKLAVVKVTEWLHPDVSLFKNRQIESLIISNGKKLQSLVGIEQASPKVLSISYAKITSISILSDVRNLKILELDHCSKISDYFLLSSDSIELLALSGNKAIDSIGFICKMPMLKRVMICVPIADGDLSPLMSLEHATVYPVKRNYSHKDSELPTANTRYCPRNIPAYRYVFADRF